MNKFKGCGAVVTGAGSGIGKALAIRLVDAGARVAISDINAETLQQTRDELIERGGTLFAVRLDVADREAVFAYAETVEQQLGTVNLVINNAGVALGSGPLWENSLEDFDWLMNINFQGVLAGTKAFLPILEKADWGHIVNISSIFGIVGVPTQAAYNASKFAVRGMTEALRQELKIANSHISCTSVHPGGIATNIARSARIVDPAGGDTEILRQTAADNFDQLARTSADTAAKKILRAVEKDKYRLLIGMDAQIVDKLQRLFPNRYGKILNWVIGDDPTQAKK